MVPICRKSLALPSPSISCLQEGRSGRASLRALSICLLEVGVGLPSRILVNLLCAGKRVGLPSRRTLSVLSWVPKTVEMKSQLSFSVPPVGSHRIAQQMQHAPSIPRVGCMHLCLDGVCSIWWPRYLFARPCIPLHSEVLLHAFSCVPHASDTASSQGAFQRMGFS